jgi:hypothetical protein
VDVTIGSFFGLGKEGKEEASDLVLVREVNIGRR